MLAIADVPHWIFYSLKFMGVIPYPYLNIKRDISLNEAPDVLLLLFYYLGRLFIGTLQTTPRCYSVTNKNIALAILFETYRRGRCTGKRFACNFITLVTTKLFLESFKLFWTGVSIWSNIHVVPSRSKSIFGAPFQKAYLTHWLMN